MSDSFQNNTDINFYELLSPSLGSHSSIDDIKREYLREYSNLIKSLKKTNNNAMEREIQKKIEGLNKIFSILSSKEKRREYDIFLTRNLVLERERKLDSIVVEDLFLSFLKIFENLNIILNIKPAKKDSKEIIIKKINKIKKELLEEKNSILNILNEQNVKIISSEPNARFYDKIHEASEIKKVPGDKDNGLYIKRIVKTQEYGAYFYDEIIKKAKVSVKVIKDLNYQHNISSSAINEEDVSMTIEFPIIADLFKKENNSDEKIVNATKTIEEPVQNNSSNINPDVSEKIDFFGKNNLDHLNENPPIDRQENIRPISHNVEPEIVRSYENPENGSNYKKKSYREMKKILKDLKDNE